MAGSGDYTALWASRRTIERRAIDLWEETTSVDEVGNRAEAYMPVWARRLAWQHGEHGKETRGLACCKPGSGYAGCWCRERPETC